MTCEERTSKRRWRAEFYIEVPEGDGGGPGSRQCGLLRNSLYGTRDAPQIWECELWRLLGGDWLAQWRGISASAHGDDVTAREDAWWLIHKFKEKYEIKTQMIGEAAGLNKQLQILNRTARWSFRGLLRMEADARHLKRGDQIFGTRKVPVQPVRQEWRPRDYQGRRQRRQHRL